MKAGPLLTGDMITAIGDGPGSRFSRDPVTITGITEKRPGTKGMTTTIGEPPVSGDPEVTGNGCNRVSSIKYQILGTGCWVPDTGLGGNAKAFLILFMMYVK